MRFFHAKINFMNITIIGAGAYGTAIGNILTANQHKVTYFDPLKTNITLAEATTDTEVIFIAIPRKTLSEFISFYPQHLKLIPTIITTKGLFDLNIFSDFTYLAALSGPAFAAELNNKKPTTLTATSELAKELLENDWLSIEVTTDLDGLFVCGALKNVYAIGSGLLSLEGNDSALLMYIEKAREELKELVSQFGGDPSTVDLACGIGDLALTCSSSQSRNYQFGVVLAQDPNHIPTQTTEGLATIQTLPAELNLPPIISTIVDIVINRTPVDTLKAAFNRDEA
jgi:glycerol-3-phosphate dehydrogenase (NAD(P)+)